MPLLEYWIIPLKSSFLFYFNLHECRSAQFEHTVVITSDGVEILTTLPEEGNVWLQLLFCDNKTLSKEPERWYHFKRMCLV